MRFQPKTDDEIKLAMCAEPGEYDFEVIAAEDGVSKSSGNPMTTISLKVFVGQGTRTIKDYLMEKLQFKLKHFMYAVGLAAEYEDGAFDAHALIGRTGKLMLGVQTQEGYGPKNTVKDYIVPGKEPVAAKPKAIAAKVDDQEPPF